MTFGRLLRTSAIHFQQTVGASHRLKFQISSLGSFAPS